MGSGARQRALTLLQERGAAEVEHVGGDLLTHLAGTETILRGWQAPEPVALAGLCHAAYGTAGFAVALLGVEERSVLVAALGTEAEAIVYRYASCDRGATYPDLGGREVRFTDRFTGSSLGLAGDELRAFALVTAANEYELARRGLVDHGVTRQIADLLDRLSPYAPEAAPAAAEVRRLASR